MALDFPSNPTNGQVFGSYIWSSSKGVWQSREESAAPAVVSAVPPSNPVTGSIWVDSSDGVSYVYYNDGSSGQWIEMVSSGVPSLQQVMPTGSIIQTARSAAPSGWLFCEGQLVSRTVYASLFDAIGTAYGSGDGLTTFALPNLKGRIPVGRDSSQAEFDVLGETGGAKTHTLSIAEMPSHTHTQDPHTHGVAYFSPSPIPTGVADNNWVHPMRTSPYNASGVINNTTATNQNTGGGGAHNNLQPYIVLNYMIKV